MIINDNPFGNITYLFCCVESDKDDQLGEIATWVRGRQTQAGPRSKGKPLMLNVNEMNLDLPSTMNLLLDYNIQLC